MTPFNRTIICSYKLYEWCLSQSWKNRKIETSPMCSEDDFYYFGRNGRVRRVDTKNKRIWAHVFENIEGFGPFPTPMQKVVRKWRAL